MSTTTTVASSGLAPSDTKRALEQNSEVPGANPVAAAAELKTETQAAKEAAAGGLDLDTLRYRAEAAEAKLAELQRAEQQRPSTSEEAPTDRMNAIIARRRQRRWDTAGGPSAAMGPGADQGSASLVATALGKANGGSTQQVELTSATVQAAPLTLQLMIPLLLMLLLFGLLSLISYALDWRGRRKGGDNSGPGRQGHRRMPSGDAPIGQPTAVCGHWSPRRGFAYSSSWHQGLSSSGDDQPFALTAPYVSREPKYSMYENLPERVERRSPSRSGAEECRRGGGACDAV